MTNQVLSLFNNQQPTTMTTNNQPGNHYASTTSLFDPSVAQLIDSAPEILRALHNIYANAGESPEWIRMTIDAALKKITTQPTNQPTT